MQIVNNNIDFCYVNAIADVKHNPIYARDNDDKLVKDIGDKLSRSYNLYIRAIDKSLFYFIINFCFAQLKQLVL